MDVALTVLFWLVQAGLAGLGVYVSLKPPPSEKHTLLVICFIVLAAAGCVTNVCQQVRSGQEQERLNNSIGSLSGKLTDSESARRADSKYLQAKLEDYKSLQELAPSLLQIAKATEGFTQKQYEEKHLNDVQLVTFARSVTERMRTVEKKCSQNEQDIENKFNSAPPPSVFNAMTLDQKQAFWAEQSRRRYSDEDNVRGECESEFRSQVLGDAVYVRRELVQRLGGPDAVRSLMSQHMHNWSTGDLAIEGIFSGPDPIGDSTTYLETLTNEFAVRRGLKQP